MHPLTVREQAEAFDLANSLRFGHLPARFSDPEPRRYLQTYIATYLKEEVAQEGLTRRPRPFLEIPRNRGFFPGGDTQRKRRREGGASLPFSCRKLFFHPGRSADRRKPAGFHTPRKTKADFTAQVLFL